MATGENKIMAKLSINKFLDTLGVVLAVRQASWDAIDESSNTIVMKPQCASARSLTYCSRGTLAEVIPGK